MIGSLEKQHIAFSNLNANTVMYEVLLTIILGVLAILIARVYQRSSQSKPQLQYQTLSKPRRMPRKIVFKRQSVSLLVIELITLQEPSDQLEVTITTLEFWKYLKIHKQRKTVPMIFWYLYGIGDGSIPMLNTSAFFRRYLSDSGLFPIEHIEGFFNLIEVIDDFIWRVLDDFDILQSKIDGDDEYIGDLVAGLKETGVLEYIKDFCTEFLTQLFADFDKVDGIFVSKSSRR